MAKAPARPKNPNDDPSILHPDIAALRSTAALPKALMGGTSVMRAMGELYLPKALRETDETYQRRLKITTLRNFYRQSLLSLAGKLVRNGLRLDESAEHKGPPEMADWLRDADNEGTPGDVLFKRAFVWAVRDAAMWMVAGYPPTLKEDGAKMTLAEERERGVRPYMIPVSVWDALGWREERVNGRRVSTQFRYVMRSEEPDGQFGMTPVLTIRVIEPTVIRDFRQNAKNEWELVASYVNTLGRLPVHRIASDMDENHHPRGGMNDLADLNLEHWQVRSDQRLALRMNSFPILFGAGIADLPPVGPESAVLVEDANAKLAYVESAGSALSAGRQELIDLEDAMRAMSAQFQVKQQVAQTATESSIDAKEANAPAQGWAINAKRGFERTMDDMAELAGKGKGPGAGGTLRVDTDALVSSMEGWKLSALQSARTQREISHEAFIAALKKADVLPDDFDAEHDQTLLDDEEPADLPGLGKPPGRK